MTIARQIVSARTYLLTRRCAQRAFLLRPDPVTELIYLYCLGEALQRYELTLHAYVVMSNHHHIIVRDNHGNYPEFLAQLHKNVATAMNALLDRRENFWAAEQANAVFLVEARDRLEKLLYVLANPVKANLVEHANEWPGASSLAMHFSERTMLVKRPRFFRTNGAMPAEVTLRVERIDGFESLTDAEWKATLEKGIRAAEEQARRVRLEKGVRLLGRKAVLRTSRDATPKTPEPKRGARPSLACLDPERRAEELALLLAFRAAREDARRRHLAEAPDVLFPFGTYRVRGFFRTAPPPTSVMAASA